MIAIRTASGSADLSKRALAQVAVLEGLIQYESLQEKEAREAFKRAFALDYDAALPGYASDKVAQVFQESRAEYQKAHPRPPPSRKPEETNPLKNGTWRLIALGAGAIGTAAGIGLLVTSSGESTLGGALLGGGLVSAAVGAIGFSIPAAAADDGTVSVAITPRGQVMAVFSTRF